MTREFLTHPYIQLWGYIGYQFSLWNSFKTSILCYIIYRLHENVKIQTYSTFILFCIKGRRSSSGASSTVTLMDISSFGS